MSGETGETFKAGVAWLIEQEMQQDIALPDDSMAYFTRRLAALSRVQAERDAEDRESASPQDDR